MLRHRGLQRWGRRPRTETDLLHRVLTRFPPVWPLKAEIDTRLWVAGRADDADRNYPFECRTALPLWLAHTAPGKRVREWRVRSSDILVIDYDSARDGGIGPLIQRVDGDLDGSPERYRPPADGDDEAPSWGRWRRDEH